MGFARKVWHLLVGIKDGLVLLAMLLFFMTLFAALTARPSPGQVREGALLIKLDGSVVEEPAAVDPLEALVAAEAPMKEYRARDVARAIDLAAKDDRIKAVAIDLSRFTGGGQVHMSEIGAAMDRARAAKKPVLTFATAYADDGVQLAAHASEVWVDPLGGAFVAGPGGERLYFGALLQRLKITTHVFKVGTYKDFVEPYLYDKASAPSLEARRALYAAVWENWKAEVARARPKADIARVTGDPVGWIKAAGGDAAKAALQAGLVDRTGDKVAFGRRLREIVGEDPLSDKPGGYAHTGMAALLAAHPQEKTGKALAVVTVAGELVDGKAGPGTAGGTRIARLIDEAASDDTAGLVLRVDSPGGSVFASEEIRTALLRYKASGRPIAVSMANVAASGGYWVSTPAQRIFAEPSTVTGSIGIFSIIPSFERALADYGVNSDGVRTTPLSGQPDLISGLTPEVESMLQANIEHNYGRFLGLVAASRGKTPEQIDAVAQGRVWDGGTARQNGLVDQFGGLNDALAWAAKSAELGDQWHPRFYGGEADPYASLVERLSGGDEDETDAPAAAGDLAALIGRQQDARLGHLAGELERLVTLRGTQALCLDCPVEPRAADAGAKGLLARLAALLGLV